MRDLARTTVLLLLASLFVACHDGDSGAFKVSKVHHPANRCFAIGASEPGRLFPQFLSVSDSGDDYGFSYQWPWRAEAFFLKPSGLGRYLLFDEGESYVTSDGSTMQRDSELLSDILLVDDSFESNAEWELEYVGGKGSKRVRLRHAKSGAFLTTDGLSGDPDEASSIWLLPRRGCAEFPEASLDAEGKVRAGKFEDGSLFGFVDTHSHILSNFGFGGAGIYHGSPFHPLGIQHALSDCEAFHGVDGRQDLFGFGFDTGGSDPSALLLSFLLGETPEPNHVTAGYPEFTDWPSAPDSSTHQVQYYKWLERAYLGGLRLVVQHATTNQIICDLMVALDAQPTRYSCNDMVGVDRIIEETYNMEAYIDAQEGGPGKGWFRIVTSPEQARRVIARGKLAVIIGIETSNLFDCFLTPSDEFPACNEADVLEALDHYHSLGVRALFPVHKYDNGFSAGDGTKAIIELGNFIQTGHFASFTTDCDTSVPTVFDKGPTSFPGLNMPREDYDSPAPNDFSNFVSDPVGTLAPFIGVLLEPGGTEEVCQSHGMTPLGEFLIEQMMQRGMIVEIDHLPRRSYKRVFEMLEQNDYPAVGTHGMNNFGKLYELGGVSKTGFSRCRSADTTATVDDGFQARLAQIEDAGAFPAEGFGFDLNGFAGAPGPRFGPNSGCRDQEDPVTYPFTSYAGDVTFHEPQLGNRTVDFNTEGMAHVGLIPELIEDIRGDGVSDAELEPLFKSAEGYIRMWEKAERRAHEMSR